MFARRAESLSYLPRATRQFSSAARSHRKHIDHYATLCVPRTATKAQIKTSYYQLSKRYHPDVVKDSASQTKFHAVSEAYAILGDDRKRREYDRSLGSPFHAAHSPGQHPQATTTRPSQQPGSTHFWPNHPRNRTRDPMDGHPHAARHGHYEYARSRNHTHQRPQPGSPTDPFSNPHVQRATGHRRSEAGFASQSNSTRPNAQQGGFESARSTLWTASSGEGGRNSASNGHPTQDEAAAESGMMRALGASGLVGVIMLVAAIGVNSNRML